MKSVHHDALVPTRNSLYKGLLDKHHMLGTCVLHMVRALYSTVQYSIVRALYSTGDLTDLTEIPHIRPISSIHCSSSPQQTKPQLNTTSTTQVPCNVTTTHRGAMKWHASWNCTCTCRIGLHLYTVHGMQQSWGGTSLPALPGRLRGLVCKSCGACALLVDSDGDSRSACMHAYVHHT